MVRRSPIRHKVRNHTRNGRPVNSYQRGSGVRSRKRTVVRGSKLVQLEFPVTAEVIDSRVYARDYDYDEGVSRPVSLRLVILTDDDPRGHEPEEWVDGVIDVFPNLDNSIREGYTVNNVSIIRDAYNSKKYTVKISLKRGVEDVETKEHEAAYMRKIAEETLPGV